jgi:hypothetical protein
MLSIGGCGMRITASNVAGYFDLICDMVERHPEPA